MQLLFSEKQRFTQWWIWLFLIGFTAFACYGVVLQVFLGISFGDHPMSNAGLIMVTLILIGGSIGMSMVQLSTYITRERIHIHFYPFLKRTFSWDDIQTAELVHVGFLGGWGIRYSPKYGTVYTVRGNEALSITLKNGSKYLIGTQKATLLRIILKEQFAEK